MITSLRLVNFKNFADETLRVGPFTVLVGANASGKSNIRDAFRLLHGIGRGYTLAEIIGGKYGPGGQLEWGGIRGAPFEIVRFGQSAFSIHLELEHQGQSSSYSIKVEFPHNGEPYVSEEDLIVESRTVYKAKSVLGSGLSVENAQETFLLSWSKPALTQIAGDKMTLFQKIIASGVLLSLRGLRFLDPEPFSMRTPSVPGATFLGEMGHNLPTTLQSICADANRKKTLTDWLHELTPMDVQDFEFPSDPNGRVHLRIRESNGNAVSAYSASDGTLRFLAMLAALFSDDHAGLYFFEEIDNGIHPSRLSLLVDLIENRTQKGGIQAVTTTHSPELLNLVNDRTFEDTSIIYRDSSSTDGIARPVPVLPNASELRKSQGLDRLLASGWMEDALAFSEEDKGDEEDDS